MRLFIFGYGFSGQALARKARLQGWQVTATYRTDDTAHLRDGVQPVSLADAEGLIDQLDQADAILITAPPGPTACPGLAVITPSLTRRKLGPRWIGYLSTTGVYGDRNGGWVFETSPVAPRSPEAQRRVVAEGDWQDVGKRFGLTVTLHRLPGIYGPGRSTLDRVRDHSARRWDLPGQVFSRIHVDDLADGLLASIVRPRPGGIYNFCDDEPAANSKVVAEACRLLGQPVPPAETLDLEALTPRARRFWTENKRVSNARAKAELGWRPTYPTYREGLAAILAAEIK